MNSIEDDRLREIRRRWEQSPGSRVFLQLADGLRRQENFSEAIQVLNRGLELNPGDFSARISLGRCHLESGDAESASDVLEGVVQDDPTQMVATKLLVKAWCDQGVGDQAAFRLDQYRILNPSDPEIDSLQERIDDLVAIEDEPTEQLDFQDKVRAGFGEEEDPAPEDASVDWDEKHFEVLEEDEDEDEEAEAVTIARPVPGGEILGAAFDLTAKRSHPPLALGTILTTLVEPFPSLHPFVAPWTGSVFSWPEKVEAPVESSRTEDSEVRAESLLSTVLEPIPVEVPTTPEEVGLEVPEEAELLPAEEPLAVVEDSLVAPEEAPDGLGELSLAGLASAAALVTAPSVLESFSEEEPTEAPASAEEEAEVEVEDVVEAVDEMVLEPELTSPESAEPAELADLLAKEVVGEEDAEEPVLYDAAIADQGEDHFAEEDDISEGEGEISLLGEPLPAVETAVAAEEIEELPAVVEELSVAQPFSLSDALEDEATEEESKSKVEGPDSELLEAVVPVDDAPSWATEAEVEIAAPDSEAVRIDEIGEEGQDVDEAFEEVIEEDMIDEEEFEPQQTMPVATATLGSLYLDQGHEEKAREIFEDVLTREPENEAAREGLYSLQSEDTEDMGLTERKIHVLKNFLSALQRESHHYVS